MGEPVIGWDLGGAHLKAARLDAQGCIGSVVQVACPLWQGMEQLEEALGVVLSEVGAARRHAVTMTGEMVDLFPHRAAGVSRLAAAMHDWLSPAELRFYAGAAGFLSADQVAAHTAELASANWLASATCVAAHRPDALFIDVGSTTIDLVPIVAGRVVARGRNDFARLVALHDRVDAALRATSQISFNDSSGVEIVVTGQLACVTRFELASSGSQAQADGLRVVIGRKLVEALPADDLLAAALAHELAHNLLGHRARLAREGRTWGRIKTTEREADRLSVWLLFNAGYDPHAAVRFFELWGPKFDLGLFATPDHDGWKARVRLVEHEIAQVEAVRRSDGKVDWRAAFGEDASTRP